MTTPAEPDTAELVARAATGDQAAIENLMQRHRNRLRKMITVRLDDRLASRLDPSDVVQETMAEAARRLPDYLRGRPVPFYPWLRSLAWNRLVDLYRFHIQSAKRNVKRELTHDLHLSDTSVAQLAQLFVGSSASPSRHAVRREMCHRVRDALGRLRPDHREVLVMRHLEQLSVGEIAVLLDVTEGTVKSRHFRAVEELRRLLPDVL